MLMDYTHEYTWSLTILPLPGEPGELDIAEKAGCFNAVTKLRFMYDENVFNQLRPFAGSDDTRVIQPRAVTARPCSYWYRMVPCQSR